MRLPCNEPKALTKIQKVRNAYLNTRKRIALTRRFISQSGKWPQPGCRQAVYLLEKRDWLGLKPRASLS